MMIIINCIIDGKIKSFEEKKLYMQQFSNKHIYIYIYTLYIIHIYIYIYIYIYMYNV